MAATTIIAHGTVLTCDATNRCGRLNIVIHNGRIAGISENLEMLLKDFPRADMYDAHGMLITPGFVNAHYHGESFLLGSLTGGLHFSLWNEDAHIKQALDRLLHSSSYDDVRRIYRASSVAHFKSGTTCVGEFPPQFDENAFVQMLDGIASTGLRALITLQNWEQIAKVQSLRDRKPNVAVNMGQESDFTVYSIEKLSQAAKQLKAPLLAHVAEQHNDAEIVRKNFQKSILSLLHSFNAVRQDTILVHANYCTEDELMMVKDAGGSVVVCPRSTAAKQTGYPALRHLSKRHVRLALGTDWGSVDMIDEMRFMSRLPLVVPGLRLFSPLEILRMATINGAIALGLSNEVGSLEQGKRADIVLFDLDDLRVPVLSPGASAETIADTVVHHLTTGDIKAVMTDGIFVCNSAQADTPLLSEAAEEFASTFKRFFSSEAPVREHESEQTEQTHNILPFTTDARSESEGFEKGFTPKPRKTTIVEIAETPDEQGTRRPKPQREPVKPELPKDTRRVFGEDDDFE